MKTWTPLSIKTTDRSQKLALIVPAEKVNMVLSSSIWVWSVLSLILSLSYGFFHTEASHHETPSFSIDQPYRTAFHFQPHHNWMNGTVLIYFPYYLFVNQYSTYRSLALFVSWSLNLDVARDETKSSLYQAVYILTWHVNQN